MKSPSSFSEPAREIPIAADVDLCVVGGGCTGTFAAIRAARMGLNVALIEVLNQFGGAETSRAVNVWHSFWSTDGAVKIMGGLSEEAMERLRTRGVIIEREKTDPAWQFCFNSAELSCELDKMVVEAGVLPYLHARVVSAPVEDGRVQAVVIEDKSGRRAIRAKQFVDASGDADLCWLAGGEESTAKRPHLQPPTMAGIFDGIKKLGSSEPDFRLGPVVFDQSNPHHLGPGFIWWAPVPGSDNLSAVFGTRVKGVDCSVAEDLTRAEMQGRGQLRQIVDAVNHGREERPVSLIGVPACIGIRDSRHARCEYQVQEMDILEGRVFDDAIAFGSYRVDVHHQAEAFESISAGDNTVLVSRTASGKTLSFLLPILNEYLNADAPFSVLLLYPTKALSRDQEGTLGKLIKACGGQLSLGTFDGDTPREERKHIQRSADFVITNPDMLHAGILPSHNRSWKNFLSRLRYIVVDEVHSYRGAFGSHVSNVFRRLTRVCALHGSDPAFVACSATIGNPQEHVEALFHDRFAVVDRDGAPRPQRDLYLVNPALVQSHGAAMYRKGPASVSIHLIRHATELGIRTICFCRARQEVERLYRAVCDGHVALRDKIKPYRGGLLPNERRQLERDLFEGRITTIITTNALELGIDIGDLDLCILSGHPGTVASFWQQAGRVGRKGSRATVVYVAKDSPVDQYLVHHPDFITQAPIEEAWLSADNPYILLQHLPCAAHEHPLRPEEPSFVGAAYDMAVDVLRDDGSIAPYRDCYRYALPDYPARGVNLRGMTDYNVEIYCGSEVIGELDPVGARGTLYKDAIYQHLGRRYMSLDLDLDLEKKLCKVEVVQVDYYTEAVWENRIEMTDVDTKKSVQASKLDFGYVYVNKQPKLYKKIRERSFENIGYGPITLPPFEYDTTGFSLLPAPEWITELDKVDKRFRDSALYGLAYLLRHVAPGLCMADRNDIATDVTNQEEKENRFRSALYLYDQLEGGAGYAEKIYDRMDEAFDLCRQVLNDCECQSGCPACVPPLPPGVPDEELEQFLIESNASVETSRSLLDYLIDGVITIPEIETIREERGVGIEPPPVDEEALKLNRRLNRASEILRKKRERTH